MTELGVPGIAGPVEIGRGGFGVVYRANEIDLDRQVAVKVLPAGLDEREMRRFDRERRALGVLSSHPHIVTVYRTGFATDGSPYIVMEYLTAGSTADHLRESGVYGWNDVLEIGIQLCGAVETAHRHGVLHRDIKPGNVLMSALTGATLADFGIARLKGAPETQSASITASVNHAPPEVIDGHRPTAAADIYSLASTLFNLLAGRAPHARAEDESMVPMLARIARDPIPPLDDEVCPHPLFAVLDRAMAKRPENRPASAAAFGEELIAAQNELGIPPSRMLVAGPDIEQTAVVEAEPGDGLRSPPPIEEASPSGAGAIIAAALFGLLVVAGLAAFVLLRSDDDDPVQTTPDREPRSVVEALGAGDALLDYESYRRVSDERSAFTLEVPSDWSEDRLVEGDTPIFQVSTDLDAALRGFDTPGVGVSATKRRIDADIALRLYDEPQCSARRPADFASGAYTGRSQLYAECGGTDGARLIVAVDDPDYSMLITFQLVDERDLAAVNRVFESLEVDPDAL